MKDRSPYEVRITRAARGAPKVAAGLRRAIRAVLRRHTVVSAHISVALVDDTAMARLNRDHLGHDGPTDVLSFDLRDAINGNSAIDGEIVLSLDTAARQARQRGHTVEAELALYAVHGTLHLLGYDDRRKADAARMHDMEDEILSSVGFGVVYADRSS
ncbi:MAG: rRNA maturation RNase YbeY [Planctomycetota bacterium]